MIKDQLHTKELARQMRQRGDSHRQISKKLNIGLGTAFNFTCDIAITWEQHVKLKKQAGIFQYSKSQRGKWSSTGSKNWAARIRYTREMLLAEIIEFNNQYHRIPTKREFNTHWAAYLRVFGSWNQAILAAGLSPNPQMFSKKFISTDGHKCDSLAEKIIDDWLSSRHIPHLRSQYYPGQQKFTVDFLVRDKHWIEFLGLKGQLRTYDEKLRRKQLLAQSLGIKIIELYPPDIYPKSQLNQKLGFLLK